MIARTILLVDDSDAVRCTVAALLEDDGHRVIEAGTLAEARARLDAALEIVILDLHLPDGRGTELVPELRRRHPGAAIVLMTGDTLDRSVRDVDLIVEKDVPPEEVVLAAERVLDKRRASTSSRVGDKVGP